MTYLSREGYEESKGQLFTVSEAFSGYENMFQKKFGTELSKIVRHFAQAFSGCSAGLTYCGLSEQGDVLPCVLAPVKIGNLLEQDLNDIWANNEILHRMRDRKNLNGSCGQCAYNGLCGGCRYTAYFLTHDWLGPDVSCPYEPLSR
jgi:radical SAM protein with 4Fe4S-binding SPASM domain